MTLPDIVYCLFLFALGACVGSFINVVVWRLPQADGVIQGIKALIWPPSHCPKCKHALAWHDNIPVFGWLRLRGKCHYCGLPISARYPTIEAICGGVFVLFYLCLFVFHMGPCLPPTAPPLYGVPSHPSSLVFIEHWPLYLLWMFAVSAMLASSLIDAEFYMIPVEIPWVLAIVGILGHGWIDGPHTPADLRVGAIGAAVAVGGGVGLLISIVLHQLGIFKTSFAAGEPLLEVDKKKLAEQEATEKASTVDKTAGKAKAAAKPTDLPAEVEMTPKQIRAELRHEMIFLLPPMLLAGMMVWLVSLGPLSGHWTISTWPDFVRGSLGALLGAMVGAFLVWITRIVGTWLAGRVAMGLGDVHLMLGIGAILGSVGVVAAFFIAPLFGLCVGLWMLISRKGRELPYGPYLGLGMVAVMLFYCGITNYLGQGIEGFGIIIRQMTGQQ